MCVRSSRWMRRVKCVMAEQRKLKNALHTLLLGEHGVGVPEHCATCAAFPLVACGR